MADGELGRDSCLKDGAHVPLGEVLRQSLSDKSLSNFFHNMAILAAIVMAYDLKNSQVSQHC